MRFWTEVWMRGKATELWLLAQGHPTDTVQAWPDFSTDSFWPELPGSHDGEPLASEFSKCFEYINLGVETGLPFVKSPWLGHLKVSFHTKETSSQILYCLSDSFLELKGENEQIWSQTLFRTVSQLFCNTDPTQSIISTQTSIIIRTPRFFRSPKPTETYTWDAC